MESEREAQQVLARMVRTLKSKRVTSDRLSEEAYQCLFAIRILLDLLRKEKGMENAKALQVAEKAVGQLSEVVTEYAGEWNSVDFLLRELEDLDLKKSA